MSITAVWQPDQLPYNDDVYGEAAGMLPERQEERFTRWWAWAERHGLNRPEFIMPQLRVPTTVAPFSFEQRFVAEALPEPSREQIARLDPWVYQVEIGAMSTRGTRHVADWNYHRYRNSLLIGTLAAIVGEKAASLSVLDVACHCGLFSLELAERGFGKVTGLDLRQANIDQARFLADVFRTPAVDFRVMNARDLGQLPAADIVLCAGLLYHVTFPLDLLRNLAALAEEFLVLDSLCHNYAFSGFHLVCGKDVQYSAEGEAAYELHPTYRALCDSLHAVGFGTVFEVVGDGAAEIPHYANGNVRTFVAARDDTGLLGDFLRRLPR